MLYSIYIITLVSEYSKECVLNSLLNASICGRKQLFVFVWHDGGFCVIFVLCFIRYSKHKLPTQAVLTQPKAIVVVCQSHRK